MSIEGTTTAPRDQIAVNSLAINVLPLVIVALALVPRLLNLGVFATVDELNFWFERSRVFLNAIRSANFAATAITDHPGVMTMWLGALGLQLRELLAQAGLLNNATAETYVALYQLPGAIVNALGVGAGYLLLRGMLPRSIALLAAILWALDPFVIAYSRVIHVDALYGTFMVLSLLAACRYWLCGAEMRFLVLSAVCAALAMITKSPGLIMAPVVFGIAVFAAWRNREPRTENREPRSSRWTTGWFIRSMLVWSAVTVFAAVIAWPALWANPAGAFGQIWLGYTAEGTQPHATGNFFLGRPDPAPGLLFYPLAILLRSTPITFVGLLALPWALRATTLTPQQRRVLLGMAWFAILFTCAMSVFAKKFNRYIEPIFPVLDLFAAIGLLWLGGMLLTRLAGRFKQRGLVRAAPGLVGATVALLSALNVAFWHPYYIAGFNQLFGGAKTGAWAFSAGWGEGLEQVAAWLNAQPDSTGVLTITTLKTGLQTYLRPGVQSEWADPGPVPPHTGYVVVYLMDAQGGQLDSPFDQFYGKVAPLKTIQIHGVDYAWIYAAPPQAERAVAASFGSGAALHGINTPQTRIVGAELHYTLFWKPGIAVPDGTHLFAHLIDSDGMRRAQIDLPFVADSLGTQTYRAMDLPLAVPADAPTGQYTLVIGLYTVDGQRLPLATNDPVDSGLDGPDALVLDRIELTAP